MILERLNLGAKLWLAPAITLALLIAIAFGGYSVMRKQQSTLDEWVNVRNPNMLAAIDVYRKTKEIHAASYQLLAWTQANYSENQVTKLRESIVQEGLEVQTKAKALAERPGLHTDEAEIARNLVSKVAEFVKAVAPVLDMADTDQSVATTLMIKAEAPYADLREQLDALSALQTATMAASAIDSSSFFVRISMAGALTSLVCVLIATFVTFAVHRSILRSVLNIRNAALRLKNRDLSFQPVVTGQDEVAVTASLMAETVTALRETIGAIHISAGQMDVAISEIASGNNDLSVRTESQAANLQQTKEDMLRLSEMVNVNADSARSASDLAMRTRQRSEQGGQMMGQVVEVMGAITESSKKVHDIIAVINDIAFQTNILALNAAVEAARAGDQGRGFAVVASEVRTLSQRSAEAASAIRQLITHSADRVADGGVLVANTGSAMEQMVVEIRTLSELIDTISRANDDQSQSMKSVTAMLDSLDQVTQKNAALVEHSAATASTMREESGHLLSAVGTFNLDAAPVTGLLA